LKSKYTFSVLKMEIVKNICISQEFIDGINNIEQIKFFDRTVGLIKYIITIRSSNSPMIYIATLDNDHLYDYGSIEESREKYTNWLNPEFRKLLETYTGVSLPLYKISQKKTRSKRHCSPLIKLTGFLGILTVFIIKQNRMIFSE
jgi:hypothetical protein